MKKSQIKKYIQKQIQKQVGYDFAGFDSRIYDLELKTGITKGTNTENLSVDITVKNAECIKPKTESFHKQASRNEQVGNIEMVVGKWYKDNDENSKYLFFVSGLDGYSTNGFGFSTLGDWFKGYSYSLSILTSCREATKEEVEQALIQEAKRRYKEGDVINGVNEKNDPKSLGCKLNDDEFYIHNDNPLSLHGRTHENTWHKNHSNPCLFENGKWAEVIEQPKEEIDWSVPGQFIKSLGTNDDPAYESIIVTSGAHLDNIFSGLCIKSSSKYQVGEFSTGWSKTACEILKN